MFKDRVTAQEYDAIVKSRSIMKEINKDFADEVDQIISDYDSRMNAANKKKTDKQNNLFKNPLIFIFYMNYTYLPIKDQIVLAESDMTQDPADRDAKRAQVDSALKDLKVKALDELKENRFLFKNYKVKEGLESSEIMLSLDSEKTSQNEKSDTSNIEKQ